MVVMIVVLAVASVLLLTWAVSTAAHGRKDAKRAIRAVAVYGADAPVVRRQEMLAGVAERVLAPAGRAVRTLVRRLTPGGYADTVRTRLLAAGSPPGFALDRFLVAKVLGVGLVPVWIVLVFAVLDADGLVALVVVTGLAIMGVVGPDALLTRRIDARRHAIERDLPDTLDLLVISTEAGLGFEQAVERTSAVTPGPLAEETRRMLQEIRMGASRADALRALDERTQCDDLRIFVLAMLQADTFGISIARILKAQADEARLRRRQRAQERAQRAPVLMLFPLVLCIFPAIFVVLLLPAMLNIVDTL
jgi:tight adherence protein C